MFIQSKEVSMSVPIISSSPYPIPQVNILNLHREQMPHDDPELISSYFFAVRKSQLTQRQPKASAYLCCQPPTHK
jgi:hypothetical protein